MPNLDWKQKELIAAQRTVIDGLVAALQKAAGHICQMQCGRGPAYDHSGLCESLNIALAQANAAIAAWERGEGMRLERKDTPTMKMDQQNDLAKAVMLKHQCDCEICAHSAAICPATASSLVMEIVTLQGEIEALKAKQIPPGWICHP